MSTLIEIKRIWSTIASLRRRVDCACSRPNIPQPPTTGGPYFLQYNPSTDTYIWATA